MITVHNVVSARRDFDDKLPGFAWPGGYPLVYFTGHGEALCRDCATKELDELCDADARLPFGDDSNLKYMDVNYEDTYICEECNTVMHGAYVEET